MADENPDLAWQTLRSQTVYDCPGFAVIHDDVELPDGTTTDYDYVSEPPAVVVLPIRPDGRVVIIEEWRQAVDRVNRGLPAGTVEPNESPREAAGRELLEETGYEAGDMVPLVTVEPSNGIVDSVHHHFLATDCEPVADQSLERDESIDVMTTELGHLREAALGGELRDGRAVLAVLAYDQLASEGTT